MSATAEKALKTSLRRSAMDYLARREHSRTELFEKLLRKYPEQETLLSPVLDQLELDGLLSDDRFAEAYIRYRRNRGFGPLLIRQELRGKGVSNSLLEIHLDSGDPQWRESLHTLVERKSRGLGSLDKDAKARQKLFRFCLSRGFSAEQIGRALRGDLEF